MNFIGGAYETKSRVVSAQELVNGYLEVGDQTISLEGAPGAVQVQPWSVRGVRNAWKRLYAVSGNNVYRVYEDGTEKFIGTIEDDGKPVSMAHNRFELLIVSNKKGWVVQKDSDELRPIVDSDFPKAIQCGFSNGYGLLLDDEGRFWWTTVNDFEEIDGLDFATPESGPEDAVSLLVDHNEVWLFGATENDPTEIWFNDGTPFARQTVLERGCRGTFSPAKLDNTVFWLGENGVVYRANGFAPQRVSNHGIETLIRGTTSDPIGFAYTWFGHDFYHLNFPGELTIVYDASIPDINKAWHTRRTMGGKDSGYFHHCNVYGRNYVGGNSLYYLDADKFDFAGEELPFIRAFGPLRFNRYGSVPFFRVLMETGDTPDFDAKKCFLEISRDGGRSYGNRVQATLGGQGDYIREVLFHALGGFYDGEGVVRLTITDNSRRSIVDVGGI